MNVQEKKKWIAFFIIGLFDSFVLYIFYHYHTLGSPAPFGIQFLLEHWWIVYLMELLLPILLIHFFLQEPLNNYGICFHKFHIQILFDLFLFVLLRFLENPEYFIPYLSTAFRTAWMFAEDHYLLHRSPEFTYFLAMLGQNMLFHDFFLTFFQSITKNRVLSPILTALFCSAFFIFLLIVFTIYYTFFLFAFICRFPNTGAKKMHHFIAHNLRLFIRILFQSYVSDCMLF